MARGINNLHYLPVALCILAVIAFFTAYGMAVAYGHVDALWPYISDAGGRAPESCIFGQFLNLAAAVAFISMYIHYKHIKEVNITDMIVVQRLNYISMWLAVFTCLGLSMVANFQYPNIAVPHMIGAFLVFGIGITYCWIQSVISYKMNNQGMSSTRTACTRFFLSFAATIFFLITLIAGPVGISKRKDHDNTTVVTPTTEASNRWNDNQQGYSDHLASTFSEWLMGFSFLLFFLTYYREFQKITVNIKVEPKTADIFSSRHVDDVTGIVA